MQNEALFDPLVPLQNYRGLKLAFETVFANELEPLALVAFDIDFFKQVNDDHGSHAIGDEGYVGSVERGERDIGVTATWQIARALESR
jgi:GGDEF domain-containing protein